MWWKNKDSKFYPYQKEAWQSYITMTCDWQEPDILICNGDLIEGRQSKQGGAELITNDRNVQGDMATICLKRWNAKKIFIAYGSKYHVGDQAEDFEYTIAQKIGATIGGRLFIDIEGFMLDCRHKLGTSRIPHGRATALLKAMMWNLVKSGLDAEPKVNMIIRSHAHYYMWIEQAGRAMMITPSLQLARGRFGSRECEGEVNWGAIKLQIDKGKLIGKEARIWKLKANRLPVHKVK